MSKRSKNEGWPSDYLSLREEVLESVRKQDQLFPMILTAFGVLATLLTSSRLSSEECQILCLALIFSALVFQCKTLQYRDTVYCISSYMKIKEVSLSLDCRWHCSLFLFQEERKRRVRTWGKKSRLSFCANKFAAFFKDISFTVFSTFSFAIMLQHNSLLSTKELFSADLFFVLVGGALLVLSCLLSWCVRCDRLRRKQYEEIWHSVSEDERTGRWFTYE